MKKVITTILLIISIFNSYSQQATDIDAKSMIVPRYANLTAITTAIPSPQTGMMVYNIGTQSYWYYNGNWTNFAVAASGSSWGTTGNAGTNSASNFFGTTDDNDLVFKRNNILVGKIDNALNNTSFGQNALAANISGDFNTVLGSNALLYNTQGHRNTAIGQKSLSYNTTGAYNTATGLGSLFGNYTGYNNTANGYGAMQLNTTGFGNTAIGMQALYGNNTGAYNIAIGYVALSNLLTGSNNIGIGYGVTVPNSAGNFQMNIGNVIYGADMSTTALGKIGIGVAAPTEKLEVAGKTKTTDLLVLNQARIEGPAISGSGIKALSLGAYGDFGVDFPGIINGRFLVKENGNIGINTQTPNSKLEVNGTLATKIIKINSISSTSLDETATVWYFTQNPNISVPNPNTCENRRYLIVNASGTQLQFSGNTFSTFVRFDGTIDSSVPINTSIEIISDGTNWLQIK